METYETYWKWIPRLSIVGIILALYLAYSFLVPEPIKVCTINASINCDPVTKGSLALFYGIPVSFIGLLGYITILVASLKRMTKLTLGMTTFGMLFCLRLTILEIFVERIICPVCVLCQLIMAVVFVLSLMIFLKERKAR
ncbi:hypothetical protein COU89_01335 [Candidatus Roizmanbacteria bacterium CG10_big_fil_rev_8_21_14_0_10_45_7]|uniref:Vitamin K epoxide reductase domain-containing protein n=1 Tax=Candidatus Roizmanbacteria bacterium CG10_big_fil_rev_8_21_14_0_10_45_7 TaxID=1974854 RepID=A0A2M8KV63_9BACT|nr:MAG: hypothetical protein COU89_01335 [Candidatus Roizmanbacteria bacterium CG10_big_fil_rev_8_21_14_0_10_45_7]